MFEDRSGQTAQHWAGLLKSEWEKRARSGSRDYYVATHDGWNDAEAWRRQAKVDVESLLSELSDEWLTAAHVLELGCGVGRLAPCLLARTASYTGVDIAPAMVEEAKLRVKEARARFFVSDGLGVPDDAKDQTYDLIVAWAVFIHCPRNLVQTIVQDAASLVRAGGRFRFQLLADPDDPTGITGPPTELATYREASEAQSNVVTTEELKLIDDHYWMGHAFRYEEARQLFESMGTELRLHRFDPSHIYCDLVRS
jgi:SAM-dependent methyltransferase